MLLKIFVLLGLAIYFYNASEVGLALMAVGGTIPGVGLILSGILAGVLIIKTWYGSAAIVAGLIAFNLVGNAWLNKQSPSPSEGTPPD